MTQTSRALVFALLVALAGIVAGCSEEGAPDDAQLRNDLAELRAQIEEAKEAAQQHKGGLAGEMAAMRREILLLSAAMLENRLIANEGGVPAKLVAPALAPNPARAEQILRHISAAEDELEKVKEEAASQEGVAANLSQTAVMTQELTLAQLRLAYYQSAYGIALPGQQRAAVGGDAPALLAAPTNDAPAGDAPSSNTPSGDAPSGDTPSGDAASGETPPGDVADRDAGPTLTQAEVDALIERAKASNTTRQAAATPSPAPTPETRDEPAAAEADEPAPVPRSLDRADYRRIQLLLQESGHNPGPVDGQLGPRTRSALIAFQRSKGLSPNGEPDAATLDALGFN